VVEKQKSYNSIWREYENGFGPPNNQILDFIYDVAKEKDKLRVVDVASGNGRYAIQIAKKGYGSVLALDISSEGCKIIEKEKNKLKLTNLKIVNLDFLKFNSTQKYDIVICSGLIEEFEDETLRIEAIKKLQSITKSPGRLIIRACLFISNRRPKKRLEDNYIKSFFDIEKWNIVCYETEPEPRHNFRSTITDNQNVIRCQTLVADKIGSNVVH